MSGLRVCTKQSKNPYYISEIDLNVYSLEEICYYLYNHVYLIDKSFFCEAFFGYIEQDLNRPGLAQGLRQLSRENAGIEEMSVLIFREAMYYDDGEIKKIQPYLGSIEKKGTQERMQMRAENFYNAGKYEKALSIYFSILMMKREFSLSTEFYGDIYFAIGIIYCKFFVYAKAEECFKKAFELCPKEIYIKYMIMVCLITDNEEEELEIIRKYNVSEEILEECKNDLAIIINKAETKANDAVKVEDIEQQYLDMLAN